MLASYAVRVEDSRGRRHPEPTHPYRNAFQRDRDRIIHSRAFRRLENKTQVFTRRYSDHFRNRLTHTIEVSQISRTIASELGLNQDLSETLALVHDIGHPPFGHAGEKALDQAGITVNKNAIPFDTNPPMKPSGIRIGTPALTTRGMKEAEMRQVGRWLSEALHRRTDAVVLAKIRKQVLDLADTFPLYPERRARAQAEVRA